MQIIRDLVLREIVVKIPNKWMKCDRKDRTLEISEHIKIDEQIGIQIEIELHKIF